MTICLSFIVIFLFHFVYHNILSQHYNDVDDFFIDATSITTITILNCNSSEAIFKVCYQREVILNSEHGIDIPSTDIWIKKRYLHGDYSYKLMYDHTSVQEMYAISCASGGLSVADEKRFVTSCRYEYLQDQPRNTPPSTPSHTQPEIQTRYSAFIIQQHPLAFLKCSFVRSII